MQYEQITMDLLRCVVLIILFRKTAGDDFIISEEVLSWKDASMQCELAKPDLTFQKTQVTVNTHFDADVWVGYYQTKTAFEYFGCTRKGFNVPMFSTMQDPGQCMSACDTGTIIGIFDNECFCFQKNYLEAASTLSGECDKNCEDRPGIVCGGHKGKDDYISLYRSLETDTPFIGGTGNCMYYDHDGFHWDICSLAYGFICEKGSSAWIVKKKNDYSWKNWKDATVNCFKNDTRPSTYNKTVSLQTEMTSTQLWTGIVKSQVIYKDTIDQSHLRVPSMYGYIEKDEQGIVLKFANVEEKKKSLCVNGSIKPPSTETSTSPSKTLSTVTKPRTTAAPVTTLSSSKESTTLTTTPNNEAGSTEQVKGENGSSNVGAIVGATLSIVVVVLVVFGVVLVLRKRGTQLPFLKKEKPTPVPNNVKINNSYVISRPVEILQSTYQSDQDEYAEIDLTTTTDNEARTGEPNGAAEYSDYAHDYFTLEKVEEKPKDYAKSEGQNGDPNTFNPYNKLSFEESSNYDHIGSSAGAGNAGRKVSDSENTYNTTDLGNSYLKTSVGVPDNTYNMTEGTEDTYNHTNLSKHQMELRASENDYDAI